MKINYITTNNFKFEIAQRYFEQLDDIELIQHKIETPEIQADSCEEIARYSAIEAAKIVGEPCVKMDAGFFINALGGFPGPFVKYVNEWLDESDILAMLDHKKDRTAYFVDVTAIGFPDGSSKVFARKEHGTIAQRSEYTPSKWPANSLFIPNGYATPLGSLDEESQKSSVVTVSGQRLLSICNYKTKLAHNGAFR